MTSPQSDLPVLYNHPFRQLCLTAIDTLGKREHRSNTWRLFRADCDIAYFAGWLLVTKSSDDGHLKVIWDDRAGGQRVDDLSPYEEMLQRWLVLEELARVSLPRDQQLHSTLPGLEGENGASPSTGN
ncbi:MAG: hypothetical protein AB7L09_01770 [Nitrospira sp.]